VADNNQSIIIVKRKKKGGGGHHGGAWKVAYADFVTGMMAFFMVMWLIASVSQENRAAISEYFRNPSALPGKSQKPAPGQNGPGGASTSPIRLSGAMDAPKSYGARPGQTMTSGQGEMDSDELKKKAKQLEYEKLESLLKQLEEAISKSQALEPFKDQLLLDISSEGLRIQIVDAQNRPMFDLGSTQLKNYTTEILRELAPYVNSVENRIGISGHTDTTPYSGRTDYSNWELSAERANSARRALVAGGYDETKVARVVGLASSVLFDKADPRNPINRRISIIIMNQETANAALNADGSKASAPKTGDQMSPSPSTKPLPEIPSKPGTQKTTPTRSKGSQSASSASTSKPNPKPMSAKQLREELSKNAGLQLDESNESSPDRPTRK
jgi:chemotaxis protein MotB